MPVYFIQAGAGGPVKIGFGKDPKKRLSQLQIGTFEKLTLVAVLAGDEQKEKKLHNKFKSYKLRGEWFSVCPEIREIIHDNPPADPGFVPLTLTPATHDELINALGGTKAVSDLTGRSQSNVSTWRDRGISWMCRPIVAHEAKKHKIELPDGFLDPIPHLGKVS